MVECPIFKEYCPGNCIDCCHRHLMKIVLKLPVDGIDMVKSIQESISLELGKELSDDEAVYIALFRYMSMKCKSLND